MEINPDRIENFSARVKANQCEVCGYTPQQLNQEKHYAYSAGHYCSRACYDTLFDICGVCNNRNMSVVTNLKYKNEKICDTCYMEREGLHIVTIGGRFK